MEVIFSEKYSYAEIHVGKNYCSLKNKSEYLEDWDIFNKRQQCFHLRPKYKSKGVFFHNGSLDKTQEITFKSLKFFTNKDRHIKRHFCNPFSSIVLKDGERRIVKKGDVITIRLYRKHRHRTFNKVFFKSNTFVTTLSFNTKTGNFMFYRLGNKEKDFKTNSFFRLEVFFNELLSLKPECVGTDIPSFNDYLFIENMCAAFGFPKQSVIENPRHYLKNDFLRLFERLFITKKRIKVPNHNVSELLTHFYPTEKFFKKNDRKLISSVLDMLSIKSKYTIKICHQNPNLNLIFLKNLINFFGDDYIDYLTQIDFQKITKTEKEPHLNKHFLFEVFDYNLSKREKKLFLNLLKEYIKENCLSTQHTLNDFKDHIRMCEKIKKYYPQTEMSFRNITEFRNEHQEFTKISASIKKGFIVEYVYQSLTIDKIEHPIPKKILLGQHDGKPVLGDDMGVYFYPFILKTEVDYFEEGKFMRHCVSSYVDKKSSIIISLRTKDGNERVTCEYDIATGRPIQQRYFCNQTPPEQFLWSLMVLDELVSKMARFGTLNWVEKRITPVLINGKKVEQEDIQQMLF